MAYFPFYMDISDKKCLVVGGGKIASRKVEVLIQFDIEIKVIATSICDEINKLNNNKLTICKRNFMDEDIRNADFIIAATNNNELNTHISDICKKNNILVNVVDVKEECNFIFPAIIKREELVIAISTGGNSPAMAAKIKKNTELTIPDYYGNLIETLGECREFIKNEIASTEIRKQVYNELIKIGEINNGKLTFEMIKEVAEKFK
jgi:siroheme synthase-like protein